MNSMWNLFKNSRFIMLTPQFFWTGISIAFYSGILVQIMSDTIEGDEEEKYKQAMLAMVCFGLGEVLGCFFIGFIVDKFGSKLAALLNTILVVLTFISTIIFICLNEFTLLAYLMTFLWGL